MDSRPSPTSPLSPPSPSQESADGAATLVSASQLLAAEPGWPMAPRTPAVQRLPGLEPGPAARLDQNVPALLIAPFPAAVFGSAARLAHRIRPGFRSSIQEGNAL